MVVLIQNHRCCYLHSVLLGMKLICYPLMNLRSKRAILRTRKQWGHPVGYNPRRVLVERLACELNLSPESVLDQLQKEREFLLEYIRYFR